MKLQPTARGRFVTLEGIEGVGKSTQLQFVADQIRRKGLTVIQTREPGGVPLAERVRELILRTDAGPMEPRTELLLMFAARSAHIVTLIEPALQRGDWVVCDRFTDATYAYQGAGRGVRRGAIDELKLWVQGSFNPDLTILLDAPWEKVAPRLHDRPTRDRFEQEDPAFFDRVRGGYLRLARSEPQRIRVVAADRPIDQVQADIGAILQEFILGNT